MRDYSIICLRCEKWLVDMFSAWEVTHLHLYYSFTSVLLVYIFTSHLHLWHVTRLMNMFSVWEVTHLHLYRWLIYICTKSFLEYWGCRSRQPGRTKLIGPGAILVLIHCAVQFGANGTNQTKEGHRGRKPVSKKLLVQLRHVTSLIYIFVTWHDSSICEPVHI